MSRSRTRELPRIVVDPEDEHLLTEFRWYHTELGYLFTYTGSRREKNLKYVGLHRMIIGAKPGEMVDHVNGDPADNRRCNLRIVTPGGNMQNRHGADPRNTTGRRGVCTNGHGKFRPFGRIDKKTVWLGTFTDLEEAASVATEWRRKHYPCFVEHG